MTFWETIQRGEYVMIALAVLFIIDICIWGIRTTKLRKERKGYSGLMHRIRDHVVEGDIENSRQLCKVVSSPGALVIETGLSRIGKPITEVSEAMRDKSLIEKETMDKGIRWTRAIAVISPLLGLGGTLVGIIDRLRDLGEADIPVDLSMLCSSISPTIVTTVAGLGVGVFALISATFLESAADLSKRRLDEIAMEFTDLLNEPS